MQFNELVTSLNMTHSESDLAEDLKLVSGILDDFYINMQSKQFNEWVISYNSYSCPTITCGVLTYNEEKRILGCLESIIDEFDEYIVLDSLSTDQTIELIKGSYPQVKIITEKWRDDFSFHRNLIRSNSSSEWIYFIDSDNIYDSTNKGKIHRIVKLLSYIGFVGVVSPVIKEHDGHIFTDNRKLFSIDSDITYFGRVHEEPLLKNGTIPIHATMEILVHHDGYDPQKTDMRSKTKRNVRLTLMMLQQDPGNPKWLYFYAREIYNIKDNPNVEELKSTLMDVIERYRSSVYKRYYPEAILFLCDLLVRTNSYSQLSQYIDLLEQVSPGCADIDYYRATMIFRDLTVRTTKLTNYVKNSLQDQEQYSYISSSKDHIRMMLVKLLWLMNNWEESYEVLRTIKDENQKLIFSNMLHDLKNWLHTIEEGQH